MGTGTIFPSLLNPMVLFSQCLQSSSSHRQKKDMFVVQKIFSSLPNDKILVSSKSKEYASHTIVTKTKLKFAVAML